MRKIMAFLLLTAGCTTAPNLDQVISPEALAADYPKLVALEAQDPLATPSNGAEVIEELDSRTASLWSRIGTLFN